MRLHRDPEPTVEPETPPQEKWRQWGDLAAGLIGFSWALFCLEVTRPKVVAILGLVGLTGVRSFYQRIIRQHLMRHYSLREQPAPLSDAYPAQPHPDLGFWQGALFWTAIVLLTVISIWEN